MIPETGGRAIYQLSDFPEEFLPALKWARKVMLPTSQAIKTLFEGGRITADQLNNISILCNIGAEGMKRVRTNYRTRMAVLKILREMGD